MIFKEKTKLFFETAKNDAMWKSAKQCFNVCILGKVSVYKCVRKITVWCIRHKRC